MPRPETGGAESPLPMVRVRRPRPPWWLGAVALGLIGVVVVSSIEAADGVADFEVDALVWVNDWPDALEPAFWALQQFGLLFAPLVAGVIVAWLGRRWTLFIPFALVLPLELLFEKTIVKSIVERERPYTSIGPEIVARGGATEGLSFPSGHTTTAFATAVLLAALLPGLWRLAPTAWATLVGLARMYMGEHNLLDVIAGAAIGTTFGLALWYLVLGRPWVAGLPSEADHDPAPSAAAHVPPGLD